MAQDFSPTEIFKRATAATLRAIAERDDLTVGFGPEPPGLAGTRVKLPNPARDLPAEEAAQLRGAADSVALRLRYHDDARAQQARAGGPLARAVFEALEQARVEALGSRRMAGVAAKPDSDARRAVSPPGLRAHHRAHREHDGRGGAPADPRGADARAAAALGAARRRSVAARGSKARSARTSPSSTAPSSTRTPMPAPPAG